MSFASNETNMSSLRVSDIYWDILNILLPPNYKASEVASTCLEVGVEQLKSILRKWKHIALTWNDDGVLIWNNQLLSLS